MKNELISSLKRTLGLRKTDFYLGIDVRCVNVLQTYYIKKYLKLINMKQTFITLLMLLIALEMNAYDVKIDGIYYNIVSKGHIAIVTYQSIEEGGTYGGYKSDYKGKIIIPSKIVYKEEEYSVTQIGDGAFGNCSQVTEIVIPNTVTSIGEEAFQCCGMNVISLPNSLKKIGDRSFAYTNLISINIPKSVKTIGVQAFEYSKKLTSVTIPNNVTAIGDEAFMFCTSLTSVNIPLSINKIGYQTFRNCNKLTSITIPNSVTYIEWNAFKDCNGLSSVTIPNSVTTIGWNAFEGCSSLTSVTIPNSVTTIGQYAFSGCSSLTSITIGSGVTNIGGFAFADCPELADVYSYKENVPSTSSNIFEGSYIEYATLHVPAGSVGSYQTTEPWSRFGNFIAMNAEINGIYYNVNITNKTAEVTYNPSLYSGNITIPDKIIFGGDNISVKSIDNSAFRDCSGLTSVTISNSVTSIGSSAFSGCSKLTSVTIPNGVNSIEEYTFAGCSDLVSVTIPNSVTSIGICAFNSCSALTSLEIPNSVTSIGKEAFKFCSSLTSISIPSSVTSINRYAFDGCSGLESVTSLATTPPQADENAFEKLDIPLYVPKGTRDAYLAASPWNKFKEIIEMEGTDEDEITIKDIGKTTWCSEYDLDFRNVEGIKAYTATGYNDVTKTIWLTRVTEVPAGTGLLVKGDAGTYKIPHVSVRAAYANWFVGNLGDAIKIEETDGDKTNYYLSGKDGTFVSVNGSANIGKNKAYLQLPTSVFGGTRSIGISYDDEDGTTSIKDLTPALSEGEGAWYTLQGQRVAKPGKGLYIKNGKKVIVR